jgi:type I restriction enzyme M protein
MNYIVSNPPFDPQTSKDERAKMCSVADVQKERFPFGIPNLIKYKKVKTKMYIYLAFLQHILYSLADNGKAAVVVPTGFVTSKNGIGYKILKYIIDKEWVKGVVTMPSNIFATTGSNVSVLFIDKSNQGGKVVLIDASNLGEDINDGENKKRKLSKEDEQKIISAFANKTAIEDFSVVLNFSDIKSKKYSLSAGQYFDIKIEHLDITAEEFTKRVETSKANLKNYFNESKTLNEKVFNSITELKYE